MNVDTTGILDKCSCGAYAGFEEGRNTRVRCIVGLSTTLLKRNEISNCLKKSDNDSDKGKKDTR